MAKLIFTDFASSTLPSAINETVDTFDISATVIGSFPAPGSGEAFICTLRNSAAGYQNNRELILVEGRADTTFSTITRSYAGTSPPTGGWPSGTVIIHDVSASFLNDVFQRSAHTLDDISDGITYVKSTSDFTATEKEKLSGIVENATANTGDVTAAAAFTTDNVLVKSDGTGKGTQASGISVDDDNNVSGIAQLTAAAVVIPLSTPEDLTDATLTLTSAYYGLPNGKPVDCNRATDQTITIDTLTSDYNGYSLGGGITKLGDGDVIIVLPGGVTWGDGTSGAITITTMGEPFKMRYNHSTLKIIIDYTGAYTQA